MRLTNKKVGDIVFNSFKKAFEEKDKGALKGNNPFRSSYFVSLIGDRLKNHFIGAKVHYQSVDSIEEKNKTSGEWLFDICATTQLEVENTGKGRGVGMMNTNILFACESEFDTSLSAFVTDFGKLICSNANQYLFIQGFNQNTELGRKGFIESRKEIIKSQLQHLIEDDFVLAFIPTPGKIGKGSFWDLNEKEVLSWASIWIYNASENKFIEYKPK